MCVQILSGTFWAAYELGFFLMFFESMPVAQRARMLTIYNLANTCAWCAGSIVGGPVIGLIRPQHDFVLDYLCHVQFRTIARPVACCCALTSASHDAPLEASLAHLRHATIGGHDEYASASNFLNPRWLPTQL